MMDALKMLLGRMVRMPMWSRTSFLFFVWLHKEPFKTVALKGLIQKCQRGKVPQEDSGPTPSSSKLLCVPYKIRCVILDYLDYMEILILKSAMQ